MQKQAMVGQNKISQVCLKGFYPVLKNIALAGFTLYL